MLSGVVGGLLVDFGVLTLRKEAIPANSPRDASGVIPRFLPSDPVIIEWRAMTVILLCVCLYRQFTSR